MNKNIYHEINNIIDKNRVVLFMKGTPKTPLCGFSASVVNILDILKVNFIGVDVLKNDTLRQSIKAFSDWPTIPQLYINKEFIGGCDITQTIYENGELQKLLHIRK